MTTPKYLFLLALLITSCVLLAGCSTPESKAAHFLERGKAAFESKDYGRAEIEFRNAIQMMPKDAEGHYQLAMVHLARDDSRGAIQWLTQATELNPKHAAAQLKLAAFMALSSDPQLLAGAQGKAQNLLATNPDDPGAISLLALTEFRLGRVDAAVAHLEEAFEKAPSDVTGALNLARMKFAQQDPAAAEMVLKRLVENAPRSADAALALAQFYISAGKKADAAAQAHRASQLDPKSSGALLMLGALQLDAGQITEADKTYRDLAALPTKEFKSIHAQFLFTQGRRPEATAELQQLVKQEPEDRNYRGMLVSAYIRQGQHSEAERLLAGVLKRNAKDSDALMQRADLYLLAGKAREAEQDLRSVLHFKPDSASAHYSLARAARLRKAVMNEREELNAVLKIDPDFLSARLDLAKLLAQSKSGQDALALLDGASEQQKKTVAYLAARNWALLTLDKRAEVRQNLDRALAVVRTPELLYQSALLKVAQKDYAGARQSLEELLKKEPDNTKALELLAISYSSEGSMAKAVQALRDHAEGRKESGPVQMLLGMWLARAGKRDEARQVFSGAQAARPEDLAPALALADMDMKDGNLSAARRNVAPVVAAHPENIHARLLLGLIELHTGNRPAAIDQYRALTTLDPTNQVALNNLAYLLASDDPDEAMKFAQSALGLDPNDASAQDTLGWIYYRKGVYPTALNHLKQAVAKQPIAAHRYHLGLAYGKMGERTLSQQHITAALQQDPNLVRTEPAP